MRRGGVVMQSLINQNCILTDLEAHNKLEAIQKMAQALNDQGYLNDIHVYIEDVLKREDVFPTYIGYNIGLPHGRSAGVKEAGLCIARLKEEVKWSDETDDQVKIIILIAVGEQNENNLHMQILAKLSRMLMHEEFRNQIISGNQESIYKLISEHIE